MALKSECPTCNGRGTVVNIGPGDVFIAKRPDQWPANATWVVLSVGVEMATMMYGPSYDGKSVVTDWTIYGIEQNMTRVYRAVR